MQQDQFEVLFCDLCGTSVPLADLERGAAIRHQAKTIGACCLSVLRKGDSPLANPGLAPATAPAASAPAAAAGAPGGESRLLPVAIFLLAALAAATIYLDQRIGVVDGELRRGQEQALQSRLSDSEVLQGVGVAMDAVARKADVEALTERLGGVDRALQLHQEQVRQQVESQRQLLGAVQQEVRQNAAAAVDYRPQFEEQRQQLQSLAASLASLQVAPPSPAAAPAVAAPQPPVADGNVAALPDALAAAVKKLGDADAAVRFEAVDTLVASKNAAVQAYLLAMVRDADVYVRRLTVDGLRDFKHADVVEALIVALADSEPTVAETAWGSLKKLTGQKIPFDASAPNKEARLRGQQRWQEWWEKNRATFGS